MGVLFLVSMRQVMFWDKMKIILLSCLIGCLADDMHMTSSSPPLTSPHVVSSSSGGHHGTGHGHTDTTSHGHHETTSYGETGIPMDHEEPVPLDHEAPVPLGGGPPCEEGISIKRTPGEPHHLTGEYRRLYDGPECPTSCAYYKLD